MVRSQVGGLADYPKKQNKAVSLSMSTSMLPFRVGQEVEAKSFEEGFRGAWFQCRIKKTFTKDGDIWYDLEYFDFPDEDISPTKAYQVARHVGGKRHLMIRPKFPTCYRKSEMPDTSKISEEVVVYDDNWRIGDVVDWWTTTSFWTGTIIGILGNGEVKLMLLPKPVGEGEEGTALTVDLRPTLNWSLENGWEVRSPKCARLIKPPTNGPQPSCSNINGSLEGNSLPLGKHNHEDDPSERKEIRVDGQLLPNSMGCDSLETVVLDLVALSCQMRRMKGLVKLLMPSARSSVPSWKFLEHRAPPM